MPMTFIECEEKLLKFVAQQGDGSTLQPVLCTCTLYAVSCTPPLPPSPLSAVPLSAQAVVGASEFK